jgi:hypothetical protein
MGLGFKQPIRASAWAKSGFSATNMAIISVRIRIMIRVMLGLW